MNDLVSNLLEQIKNGEYRDLYFTTYNFLEENNWLLEQKTLNGKDYDIDDLSFIKLELPVIDSVSLDVNDALVRKCVEELRKILIKASHNRMGLFIMKDINVIMVVKPKNFDVFMLNFAV